MYIYTYTQHIFIKRVGVTSFYDHLLLLFDCNPSPPCSLEQYLAIPQIKMRRHPSNASFSGLICVAWIHVRMQIRKYISEILRLYSHG